MSDKDTQTPAAEKPPAAAKDDKTQEDHGGAAKEEAAPRAPGKQLLSHYRGMPKQWEKNRNNPDMHPEKKVS
ncbi:hypothetical protein F4780DRAFT_776843 [Xylariomycetidae sp. FL0641]|nr:hypothetical protein F4780DRAFT_776843 [Xylariomycetidae sp. FL0641]